jgi:hypothetical protein
MIQLALASSLILKVITKKKIKDPLKKNRKLLKEYFPEKCKRLEISQLNSKIKI